ncbi:hypothetical protein [Deinococcus yavapaiensis]|uniref:Uncharacterized protein n=1 Tax=Deinococcus yavapaiensis KR-236 TaxID=694435 RepID=A0A318SE53_9DEIO|nr:hypothetical protein [Deinococcus yavapaiensis]PYE55818.1 hypothetical protein DES52_102183 [Deinococcus yavapaiensis KR-236]
MIRRAVMVTLLAALVTPGALADHQNETLKGLRTADLCAPEVYAYLDEDRDDDFEVLLVNALNRYSQAQTFTWGDDKTCTVETSLVLSAYEEGRGSFVYMLTLSLDLKDDTTVLVGGRRVKLVAPTIWQSSYYGRYASNFEDLASRDLRDLFSSFTGAWRGTHP